MLPQNLYRMKETQMNQQVNYKVTSCSFFLQELDALHRMCPSKLLDSYWVNQCHKMTNGTKEHLVV